jgi:hypothetical protein
MLRSLLETIEIPASHLLELFKAMRKEVQTSKLWLLLRLLFLHHRRLQADIETAEGVLKIKDIKWKCDFFLEFQKDQTLPLLRNLITVGTETEFLEAKRGCSIFAHSPTLKSSSGDPRLLLTFLEQGDSGALKRAQEVVTENRKKSVNSRDQADRSFFARSALLYAIASGSLPLYGATVTWARRFIRDPLTTKSLFAKSTTNTEEGIALLSGVPSEKSQYTDTAAIVRSVAEANDIISVFSDMRFEASKEPHFKAYDWQGPLVLFDDVICTRHDRAADAQRALKLSDVGLIQTLWLGTLKTLLNMEGKEKEMELLLSRVLLSTQYLAHLAIEALEKLLSVSNSDKASATIESKTFNLLRRLGASDSPQIASDLLLRAILERPEASSWHRILLNKGLITRLPAVDAQGLLMSFATSIIKKLDLQAQRVSSQSSEPSQAAPIIKVTTVKYLAQILGDSELVPPNFAVDILSSLLRGDLHLDVCIAIVESLLAMLTRCTSESSKPLASRLLSALENIIPIASSPHERRPLREADWLEAERTKIAPEVYDEGDMKALPPLLNLVTVWNPGSRWRSHIIQRILLPIVETSIATNGRWVKIFLAQHELGLQEFPSTPVKSSLLPIMLSINPELMPASMLKLWHKMILANINPSEEMANVIKKVQADAVLRKSSQGRHWLTLFGMENGVHGLRDVKLATQILHWKESEIKNGIDLRQIQEVLFSHAEALLHLSDDICEHWNQFIRLLEPPLSRYSPHENKIAWATNTRPVIEKIVYHLRSLRTASWQQNPDRRPSILPLEFPLRLWLLSYPDLTHSVSSTDTNRITSYQIFAQELAGYCYSEFAAASDDRSLAVKIRDDFDRLSAAASKGCTSNSATLWVTYYLGSLDLDLGLGENYALSSSSLNSQAGGDVRIELVESLLLENKGLREREESEEFRRVVKMVEEWKQSVNEHIRMRGFRVAKNLS